MSDTALAFFFTANAALLGWVAWLLHSRARRRAEAQAALVQRILDRFQSPQEVADFLETDSGRRLLASVGGAGTSPAQRILAAINAGVILCAIGFGVIFALEGMEDPGAMLPGGVILGAGIGCLVSAWVSKRLSARWGLLEKKGA